MNFCHLMVVRFSQFLFSLSKSRALRRTSKSPLLLILSFFCVLILKSIRSSRRESALFHQLKRERISDAIFEPNFDYYLSACVIVRESSDIIGEFLVRNFAAGVDHFFIYGDDNDNEEISRLKTMFSKLQGLVTYVQDGRNAPEDEEDMDKYVQMRMYRHCLQSFGNTSKWMALIDTDEFFETSGLHFRNVPSVEMGQRAFMHEILSQYEMLPIVCPRWKTSLTNGRLYPLDWGETLHDVFPNTCTLSLNNTEKLSFRKSILQPAFLDYNRSPKADIAIHKGFYFTGEKSELLCKKGLGNMLAPPIYLIHYWSRDVFSYLKKIRRGRPRKNVPPRNLADLFHRENACISERTAGSQDVRNDFIRKFVKELPFYAVKSNEIANAQEAIGDVLHNMHNYSFCEHHVAKFISNMKGGKRFSNANYCMLRDSVACRHFKGESRLSWPFPWTEYLSNCNGEDEDDSFFVAIGESL